MTELAYLEKVDPSRRMMRFYAIWIAPTLFGEWAMIREWGRIGSPGQLRQSLSGNFVMVLRFLRVCAS